TSFKALYPFTARNGEELSFSADDIIDVDDTTECEEGWLYGSKQGRMGWFPQSYVERTVAKAAGVKSMFAQRFLSLSFLSLPFDYNLVVGNLLAQALCSWTAKTDNHLNFNKDDVIQVLDKREGEWWTGSVGDCTGLFPSNYVKPKEADVRTLNTNYTQWW
uniref:SH3 domain-containing protein n=1 Tax=Mola mola TaxID=94237 RepID=A0A3Q3VLR6_MOLML